MSADYNLYVKKEYPNPDECIYGINIDACFNSNIICLLFQTIQERDCVRDEYNDIRLCKVCRRDFIAVRELLLCDNNVDEFEREIALGQLDEIVDSCSDEDRLILEIC